MKKDINVINKRCYVACNENALSTEKIIKVWHVKIWDNYLINSDLINDDNEGFLILYKATSHINKEIVKDYIFGNGEVSFILGGLTRFFRYSGE